MTERLYDLNKDPEEDHNVFGEPGYESIAKELKEALLYHFMSTHPLADSITDSMSMLEKFAFFTVPRDKGSRPGSR
ncbi:MAG TPA: hypothetical protein DEQ09_08905 [Bacteroidales bacterium]|nr:hypothetical protein [Bacteroidales bacterium]